MPNFIRDIQKTDTTSFPYIFEQNVTVRTKVAGGLIRCNVYRPKTDARVPVIVTYGPYGKDIHYEIFHPSSFAEVNPEHHSAHSAWETPDPGFWTRHGYAVVRADERGLGQSPGVLDTMSRGTSEAFFDLIEWAAEQKWSSGKVGLLATMEVVSGASLHGSPKVSQLSSLGRGCQTTIAIAVDKVAFCLMASSNSGGIVRSSPTSTGAQDVLHVTGGPDTIEGDLPKEELAANRRDQTQDNVANRFRDEPYYASKEYTMSDIQVPVLSVANWGGICLHLRGNVEGWTWAGSPLKYLRFITGRHDLPFYYHAEVEVQRSFLDAFLKGEDREGWSVPGKLAPVSIILRKGDVGFNDAKAEQAYLRRSENEWPIARTQYTPFFLHPDGRLTIDETAVKDLPVTKISYPALGTLNNPQLLRAETEPFTQETEITGHIVAHLNVSVTPYPDSEIIPSDIDLFLTLRHISPAGQEVFYTGTAGDPVPLTKGWLRVSLRKTDPNHHKHRAWLPHRNYVSTDVEPVIVGDVYTVDVEIWPTNVVVERGGKIVLEVASGDTQGCGVFQHDSPIDRSKEKFHGLNHIHFGPQFQNYVSLPIIPPKDDGIVS
ncbi:Peptidase S15/CocE/NonD C-terminal [Penicillium expansum]|nr:Peptidase S15/CocE/NonD C-terminal [Penicillium expansum]